MYSDKNNLILQKHAQSFFPNQLNSKLILQCLSYTQQRALMLKKTQEFENQMKEDLINVEKLRITGRQFYKTFTIGKDKFRSNSTRIKDIKVIVDKPEQLLKSINHTRQKRNYEGELEALQRINVGTPHQILTNIHRKKDNFQAQQRSQKTYQFESLELKRAEDDIYEKMILENPTVYKKIMMAYNASKRQYDKQSYKLKIKKLQGKRQTSQTPQKYPSKNRLFSKRDTNFKDNSICNKNRQFQIFISLTNKIIVIPPIDFTYKAYICRGNNGMLVRSLIKSRPWWTTKDKEEMHSCNLVWTQWKNNKTINRLPAKEALRQPNNSEGQKWEKSTTPIPFFKSIDGEDGLQLLKKLTFNQKKQFLLHFTKFKSQNNYLMLQKIINQQRFQEMTSKWFKNCPQKQVEKGQQMANHIPGCLSLHSKKQLFYNLKIYYSKQDTDIFSVVPLTFHIREGSDDPQFIKFTEAYNEFALKSKGKSRSHNIWICKPGQNSNRGNGITVLNNLQQITTLANQKCKDNRTIIIQKYFESPFLYNKRKFDIRCYILITTVNGIIKGYWYQEGYIRTSSKQFSLRNLDNKYIHLTNDAIQKKSEEYGKFQNFNKVSYADFEKYIETNYGEDKLNFSSTLLKMKKIATDLIHSVAHKLNPDKKQYCFELFGLDYMLDQKLNPFLIQANSNPCISVDGSVLAKIIPSMLQNVFRIAVDPVFPPPFSIKNKPLQFKQQNPLQVNKFVVVYDSFFDKNLRHERQQQLQNCVNDYEEQIQKQQEQ